MRFKRHPAVPRPVMTTAGALWEEFAAIHGEAEPASVDHAPEARLRAYYAAAQVKEQAALCLSGGGIRSAAFCLGVVQGLARLGLLDRFHYLSTVSGGGYAGAALTSTMREKSEFVLGYPGPRRTMHLLTPFTIVTSHAQCGISATTRTSYCRVAGGGTSRSTS